MTTSLIPITGSEDTPSIDNEWFPTNLHHPSFWTGPAGLEGYISISDNLHWFFPSKEEHKFNYPVLFSRVLPLIWRVYKDSKGNIIQEDPARTLKTGIHHRRYLSPDEVRKMIWTDLQMLNTIFHNSTLLRKYFQIDAWKKYGVKFMPTNAHILQHLPVLEPNSELFPLLQLSHDGDDFVIRKFILQQEEEQSMSFGSTLMPFLNRQVPSDELLEMYNTYFSDSKQRLPRQVKLNQLVAEDGLLLEKVVHSEKRQTKLFYKVTQPKTNLSPIA